MFGVRYIIPEIKKRISATNKTNMGTNNRNRTSNAVISKVEVQNKFPITKIPIKIVKITNVPNKIFLVVSIYKNQKELGFKEILLKKQESPSGKS